MPVAVSQELIDLSSDAHRLHRPGGPPRRGAYRQEIRETGTFEAYKDERAKMRKRSAELGFFGLHMPEEVGGGGLSYLGQVLLHEEVSRSGLLLAMFESVFPVVTGPTPIYMDCTEEQREKYLYPLMNADKATCFALTEPGAGSDAQRIQTKAVKDGDGWTSTAASISSPGARSPTSRWCSR